MAENKITLDSAKQLGTYHILRLLVAYEKSQKINKLILSLRKDNKPDQVLIEQKNLEKMYEIYNTTECSMGETFILFEELHKRGKIPQPFTIAPLTFPQLICFCVDKFRIFGCVEFIEKDTNRLLNEDEVCALYKQKATSYLQSYLHPPGLPAYATM
ncbi:MAG: hypothetical protein Edafosvirus1_25 [Edafosvirus sp.]|uniref:Uncharacterized protein n=1 Tax=Edafosvirus sp. TaxID=2487765 RepID=A0A3G4ZTP0_9VIRU|nr:MAG: hypothetical protein Edafosvirus1_25 [Edafosvirus sp.]